MLSLRFYCTQFERNTWFLQTKVKWHLHLYPSLSSNKSDIVERSHYMLGRFRLGRCSSMVTRTFPISEQMLCINYHVARIFNINNGTFKMNDFLVITHVNVVLIKTKYSHLHAVYVCKNNRGCHSYRIFKNVLFCKIQTRCIFKEITKNWRLKMSKRSNYKKY